jgi:hypothetical protein
MMNINAEQVQKSCTGTQLLNKEVKNILSTMQSSITEAGKNGSTSVTIPVPMNFNIGGMDNMTAQTIIYHRLIKELEDNGFTVNIYTTKSECKYCVRWDFKKKDGDLSKMREEIAARIVKSKKKSP